MKYSIGALARAASVGVETVRYYQRRGMLAVPVMVAGRGKREYGPDDLRRLRFIRSAQAAGFTLAEISELLALQGEADRAKVRALALKRIEALDDKIAQMTAARAALQRMAAECEAQEMAGSAGCPILRAFDGGSAEQLMP